MSESSLIRKLKVSFLIYGCILLVYAISLTTSRMLFTLYFNYGGIGIFFYVGNVIGIFAEIVHHLIIIALIIILIQFVRIQMQNKTQKGRILVFLSIIALLFWVLYNTGILMYLVNTSGFDPMIINPQPVIDKYNRRVLLYYCFPLGFSITYMFLWLLLLKPIKANSLIIIGVGVRILYYLWMCISRLLIWKLSISFSYTILGVIVDLLFGICAIFEFIGYIMLIAQRLDTMEIK